mmetsp:Transcript_133012/g.384698  ORF Transcript_133012/g.384698 Transcript_133012/m.384698 type:complete len:421 (-) Transcript_133012:132-1394(-)
MGLSPSCRGVLGLSLSQAASATTALATLFAKNLAAHGVDIPLSQTFLFYFILSVILVTFHIASRCILRRGAPARNVELSADDERSQCTRSSLELELQTGAASSPRTAALPIDELSTCDPSEEILVADVANWRVWLRRFTGEGGGLSVGCLCCLSAFCDVQGNVLQICAVRHSSMTTILFLGSGGILPAVLILGTAFLGHRYTLQHVLGVVSACMGFVLLVVSDAWAARPLEELPDAVLPDSPPEVLSALWGAALCAASALCFAVSSLGQEAILGRGCSPSALLKRIQPTAAVLSCLQVLACGRHELVQVAQVLHGRGSALVALIAFEAAVVAIYVAQPWVIAFGGAAFFNLGLLMSNVYGAVLAAVFLNEPVGSPAKLFGGSAVLLGLMLFYNAPEVPDNSAAPHPGAPTPSRSAGPSLA